MPFGVALSVALSIAGVTKKMRQIANGEDVGAEKLENAFGDARFVKACPTV